MPLFRGKTLHTYKSTDYNALIAYTPPDLTVPGFMNMYRGLLLREELGDIWSVAKGATQLEVKGKKKGIIAVKFVDMSYVTELQDLLNRSQPHLSKHGFTSIRVRDIPSKGAIDIWQPFIGQIQFRKMLSMQLEMREVEEKKLEQERLEKEKEKAEKEKKKAEKEKKKAEKKTEKKTEKKAEKKEEKKHEKVVVEDVDV